jgi:hypothetical protein
MTPICVKQAQISMVPGGQYALHNVPPYNPENKNLFRIAAQLIHNHRGPRRQEPLKSKL